MGFGLIEEQQTGVTQKRIGNGANVEGQIKIDLSVESYDGDVWRFDKNGVALRTSGDPTNGRWQKNNIKPPSLKKIQQTLKATGATIIKISTEGRFTVVDYTT